MSTKLGLSCMAAAVLAGAVFLGGGARVEADDAYISFTYISTPDRPLPENVRFITVERPNYDNRHRDDGIMRDGLDRQYRVMVRRLEDRMKDGAEQVNVLDREDIVNRETEMRRGGIDPEERPDPTNFVADAQIIPRLGVEAQVIPYQKKVPLPKQIVTGQQYEECAKLIINVHCDLKLQFTATGATVSYADILTHEEETKSGWFGYQTKELANFENVQVVIDRLVREHVDAFVARLLPIERRFEEQFKANKEVRGAAAQLTAGDLQGARETAAHYYAVRAGKNKSHKAPDAAFMVGLTYEIEGDFEKAREWYSRAVKDRPAEPAFKRGLERALARDKRLCSK